MIKESIIKKAKKLTEINLDNATEGEVENAGLALKRLLHRHNLSMFDVDSFQFHEGATEKHYFTKYKNLPNWLMVLSTAIAEGFDCILLVGSHGSGLNCKRTLSFIGTESDAAIAAYYFNFLLDRLPKLADEKGRLNWFEGKALQRYKDSFIKMAAHSPIFSRLFSCVRLMCEFLVRSQGGLSSFECFVVYKRFHLWIVKHKNFGHSFAGAHDSR